MIDFALETITPDDARRILIEHDEAVAAGLIINRTRKPAAIARYASDQRLNQWYAETGETLKFQTLDKVLLGRNLIDGQTRIAACVESGVPLTVYVARGVAREAFGFIDGGEKRRLRDVLRIAQIPDPDLLERTLNWLGQWDPATGRLGNVAVSTQRARKLLDSDPAIRKSVDAAKNLRSTKLMSVALGAFLHRIFSDYDRPLADAFIRDIADGENLKKFDPFFELRKILLANKGNRGKLPQRYIIAIAIKAWNAKRGGRSVKQLRFNKGTDFPLLERGNAADELDTARPLVDEAAEATV